MAKFGQHRNLGWGRLFGLPFLVRRAESGERRAESGERRAESGERRAESGETGDTLGAESADPTFD